MLLGFRLALDVDIRDRVSQMNRKLFITALIQQHLQRGAFGIAVLAVPRKYVMVRGNAAEEDRIDVAITAVMRALQNVNLDLALPVLLQKTHELEPFEHLVATRIAGEQNSLLA